MKYYQIKKYILLLLVIVLLYIFIKYLLLRTLDYTNFVVFHDIFSQAEIKNIQNCIGNKNEINYCFTQCQSNILSKIKSKLNVNYMNIGLARLSNNNNNDAQSYHRDVKPIWNFKGNYPKVYTIVCYFDDASLSMGNKILLLKPGDIVIFNSTNMHKANNISIYNKQRRVLQFFHVFFDKNEEDYFYKNHSFCKHIDVSTLMKQVTYLFDIKFMFEYFNISRFINGSECNKLFSTNIHEESYVTTIDNIKYYHYF